MKKKIICIIVIVSIFIFCIYYFKNDVSNNHVNESILTVDMYGITKIELVFEYGEINQDSFILNETTIKFDTDNIFSYIGHENDEYDGKLKIIRVNNDINNKVISFSCINDGDVELNVQFKKEKNMVNIKLNLEGLGGLNIKDNLYELPQMYNNTHPVIVYCSIDEL